jgi:hypothetical protein
MIVVITFSSYAQDSVAAGALHRSCLQLMFKFKLFNIGNVKNPSDTDTGLAVEQ